MADTRHQATTQRDKALHSDLSIRQRNAVDVLALGKTDAETAELVGCHRVTVTNWRRLPAFRAALDARRDSIWQADGDILREALGRIVDAAVGDLAEQMCGQNSTRAIELLLRWSQAHTPPLGKRQSCQ